MPKQLVFFDLLMEVDDVSRDMVKLLVTFMADFKNVSKYAKKAKELEHKGDTKTHEIIDKLNRTFITPFDREDIYMLAHELDDVIDLLEDTIHEIQLYGITKKVAAMDEFVPLIKEASDCLQKLLSSMREMKPTAQFAKLKRKIHELEDAGDSVFSRAIEQLFKNEKDPLMVVKLKDILEGLEAVMDKYQHISNIIEGIVVKSS